MLQQQRRHNQETKYQWPERRDGQYPHGALERLRSVLRQKFELGVTR